MDPIQRCRNSADATKSAILLALKWSNNFFTLAFSALRYTPPHIPKFTHDTALSQREPYAPAVFSYSVRRTGDVAELRCIVCVYGHSTVWESTHKGATSALSLLMEYLQEISSSQCQQGSPKEVRGHSLQYCCPGQLHITLFLFLQTPSIEV